ncbi:hypothetical protein Csa_023523, partial [Cucumis sativus]
HLDFWPAAFDPLQIIIEYAKQTHDLQKRCPQPKKAYGSNNVSKHIEQVRSYSNFIESKNINVIVGAASTFKEK